MLPVAGLHGGSWCDRARWACTSQDQTNQTPICATGAQFQVGHASLQRSWSQAMILLVDLSYPGSQEDIGSYWRSAHLLAADAISRARIAAALYLPPPAIVHLPLCLKGYKWQPAGPRSLLPTAQSFVW